MCDATQFRHGMQVTSCVSVWPARAGASADSQREKKNSNGRLIKNIPRAALFVSGCSLGSLRAAADRRLWQV